MADLIPWSNLLAPYNSPNQMAEQNANIQQTQAQTGLIGAQTGLVGQQTQAADIANQGAATQLQMLRQALNGGMPDASAVPGATPSPKGLSGQATAGPPTGDAGAGHPESYPSPDEMQSYVQRQVGQLPVQFTPSELQWVQRMKSTGNPLLAAQADAFVQGRTQATANENAERQYKAQTAYANASAVVKAGEDGAGFAVLNRLSPDLARGVAAQHPEDFTTDSIGNIVATPAGEKDIVAYAKSGAASTYPHTGYESTMQNGQLVDVKSGKVVPGVSQILPGLNAEQRQKVWDQATAPVTVRNSDGTESQMPAYQASGVMGGPVYRTPWDMVSAADKAARKPNNTDNGPTPGPSAPSAQPTDTTTPTMLRSAPQPQPAPTASSAPQSTVPQANPAGSRPTPAPGSNGSTQAPFLPGVNIDALPKSPPPVAGRTPTVTEQATNDARKEGLKEALQQQAETIQNNTLLSQFQQKLSNVNPRDVGPGSEAYKAMLGVQTAVTGKPPQDLVDMGVLDKFANQLGVQNVRQLLSGQRITNQEMMNFLTRASASTTQPLDVMKTIIAYQKANNDYDRMSSATKLAALQKGADPFHLPGALDAAAPRDTYVQQSMDKALGAAPANRPGQQSSGPSPSVNAQGWKLMTDAKGRQAYVSPDGSKFQRVQ